ncbi:cyd operon protein YbgE [Mixta hanseatica]|uniref:Cyd operon protein YbgE n=1 Tax=Mixta hanseatica TaxID=2872648 RepID=A0ABY4RF01_9GAMM|nr:cyd operon protein YbgE [Mixta hanseatica]UQY45385.1 cyd operon protein YbgE [Mixta hanseatica]
MRQRLQQLYLIMDKRPLRALSLLLALLLAGCLFWDPTRFAASTSSLTVWQGLILIWAVCAGVVHGVGFRPRRVRWQTFFSPLLALTALLLGTLFFFY